jgi:hypothetical protein
MCIARRKSNAANKRATENSRLHGIFQAEVKTAGASAKSVILIF